MEDREELLSLHQDINNVLGAEIADLRSLASIAGLDPSTDFRAADFCEFNFDYQDLRGFDFTEANLRKASFCSTNLSDVKFKDADLSEANLSGANLSGANLSEANLSGANLSGANLSGANLSGADREESTMTTSIIGLFASPDLADKVRGELIKVGVKKDAVSVFSDKAGSKLVRELVERGYQEDRAHQYAQAMENGGIVIAAEADDNKVDEVIEVMNRFDLKTPEELIKRPGHGRNEEVETAQAVEETVRIGKEQVTGGKRLVTNVTEREIEKPVTLREETVEVERSRENRRLSPDEASRAFEEKTIEMTATNERPVVSKEARVIEEVALRKQSDERKEVIHDTVRRSEVEVEDIGQQAKGGKDKGS
jgi:stress response protein YsnF